MEAAGGAVTRRFRPDELAPVTKTRFNQVMRAGGRPGARQCWGAQTTDGVWDFDREESPGTPWLIYHRPSVADGTQTGPVAQMGTLPACQWYVKAGHAAADLARLNAHDRGDHAAARDTRCVRC
jgi:hypothetical protein